MLKQHDFVTSLECGMHYTHTYRHMHENTLFNLLNDLFAISTEYFHFMFWNFYTSLLKAPFIDVFLVRHLHGINDKVTERGLNTFSFQFLKNII